jgi:hypothetical protein
LQADLVVTGGENQCELWKGFSDRGLDQDATLVGGTPWGGGMRKNVSFPSMIIYFAFFFVTLLDETLRERRFQKASVETILLDLATIVHCH